jgi:glyoxylase-like metal-dependent hydrolase (beta-lactamase superfamily II)/rhodanese-related sulfurtransferase
MRTMTSEATAGAGRNTVSVRAFRADEGCQAHLIRDLASGKAVVIDPRLDQIDEILEAAGEDHLEVAFVLDTHTHADHLSGVRDIAQRTGARILAHPGSKGGGEPLADGSVFELGESRVQVIHSPGHTPDSLSLLVDGHLFTGDALFPGSAGRTDFMGGSASDLYDSFRRFEALPEETVVHPGHDYLGRPTTTIGEERRENELMRETDRTRLVARMSKKGPLPAHMKAILAFNSRGQSDSPSESQSDRWISPLELAARRRLSASAKNLHVVDVRSPSEFTSARIDGALSIPLEQFEARIGEIPAGGDIVLLCRSGLRSEEAARMLDQRGRKARQLEGGLAGWTQTGLPTVGRGHLSIDRQVQLVVGTGVVAGSALAALVSPWFLVVPAFFGAGLTFAGLSGTCTLAYLLGRMPWNRRQDEAGSPCAVATSAACAPGKDA